MIGTSYTELNQRDASCSEVRTARSLPLRFECIAQRDNALATLSTLNTMLAYYMATSFQVVV